MSLAKAGGSRSRTQRLIQERAASGAKPSGTIGRAVTVMADVVSVDPKARSITLKGRAGSDVDINVENPDRLKNIRKGGSRRGGYTEAIAISVTPGTR
ncbi:hypothetical protein [Paraburkholderia sp. PGU19]|uniref:hypothetical protein n=1 Tax=Paraburkholderia sp. PGU19 TaxID=2735434 RepID=UPI001FB07D9E|nr:hypothetical protein [Paraburkholderia sp. PGU19]